MPIYIFECSDCQSNYEELTKYNPTGYPDIKCPNCNSKNKIQIPARISFNFSDPRDTDRWNNSSTGHDYRFKHGAPKVKAERKMAEALSHMGTDPYGSPDQVKQDIELDTGIHDPETRPGLS